MSSPAAYAPVDRTVVQWTGGMNGGESRRMSELEDVERLVLLGEPGSGKSAAFALAAAAIGVPVVSARDFVEGAQPEGSVVFIDALEEYRIGEPVHERLADVISALKRSSYIRWRLACRSISLPPSELRSIETKLGAVETWLLKGLTPYETRMLLGFFGEADPAGFVDRVHAVAAAPLLENPATLKLVWQVFDDEDLATRGDLLEKAVWKMAHEINPDYPDLDKRPLASKILEAAGIASLVLLLSGRSDIWDSGKSAIGDHLVTREDLLKAQVDTVALHFAIDTPLFVGAGSAFHPTHRIVAEYLAGCALADATEPQGERAALTIDRALAFLCGAGDRPAPALTGVFAWFVSGLSETRHVARALELAKANPEAILFHGDPAKLPTAHRRAVLAAIGGEDPWFLSQTQGATAIAGLAGEDLAEELIAIATGPNEDDHRRILVLEALAAGRPVASLRPRLLAYGADPSIHEWFRRRAMAAAFNGAPDALPMRRGLLKGLAEEPGGGPLMLRLFLTAGLVGDGATVEEVRMALSTYADSHSDDSRGVRDLADALVVRPMPELFDEPFVTAPKLESRGFEVRPILERVAAANVKASPDISATRLYRWVVNLNLEPVHKFGRPMHEAIGAWLDVDGARPLALFDALIADRHPRNTWSAGHEYTCLTGREVPAEVRETIVERLEAEAKQPTRSRVARLDGLGELAARLTQPARDHALLRTRVLAAMSLNPDIHRLTLEWVRAADEKPWEAEEAALAAERKEHRLGQQAHDREWLAKRAELVRTGGQPDALVYAAEIWLGYGHGETIPEGHDRLVGWFGPDAAVDLRAGFAHLAADFPESVAEQGEMDGQNLTSGLRTVALVYAAEAVAAGAEIELSLPTAFAVLSRLHELQTSDLQARVRRLAAERIGRDVEGAAALLVFWQRAIASGATYLSYVADLEDAGPSAGRALEELLHHQPDLSAPVLKSALLAAAGLLKGATLRSVVEDALTRSLSPDAGRLWHLLAFLLDPTRDPDALLSALASADHATLLGELLNVVVHHGLHRDAEEALVRDRRVVEHLAALVTPEDDFRKRDTGQQIVAAAIARLASSPLASAGEALAALRAIDALEAWSSLLTSKMAAQAKLRREAEFKAPTPAQVATALRGGPPATPADLRAVLREVLAGLDRDTRTGPTSPWRGYWNRPHKGKRSPKIENDCRDLLTDRLMDRLAPYRIAVSASTEHRSRNDRRVDLVVIGENDAAVPIEAKRHYNSELWTAVGDQLLPYSETLGASDHGIYLIFWFGLGDHGAVPTPPPGLGPITSAGTLRAALVAHLRPELRQKIDIVVLDVAHQETVTERKDRETTEREAARIAAGKAPRRRAVQGSAQGV